jgi:hypothetical protein
MIGSCLAAFSIGVPFQGPLHNGATRGFIGYTIVLVIFAQIIIQDEILDSLLFLSLGGLL